MREAKNLGMVRAFGVALIALAVVVPVSPASAVSSARGGIELSTDGVVYTLAYPGALWSLTEPLIPGSAVDQDFWVRNSSTAPGVLRVSLSDVVTTDDDLADALTVSATLAGAGSPAPAVPLSAANPCAMLLEGPVLQPGETARVHTRLVLGNLDGQDGQGATAWTNLRVALLHPASAPFSVTDCGPTGAEIPVLGEPERRPQTVPSVAPVASRTPKDTTDTTESPTSSPGGPVSALRSTGGSPAVPLPLQAFVDPNTGDLNVPVIGVIVGSFLAGVGAFWLLAWRRRRTRNDQPVGESL